LLARPPIEGAAQAAPFALRGAGNGRKSARTRRSTRSATSAAARDHRRRRRDPAEPEHDTLCARLDLDPMITHQMPLSEINTAST
jgi:hypothetical protein